MSGINSFIPEIPEEVRNARIGQGFDSTIGKLKSNGEIFHLGKLNRADHFEQTDGSLTTIYQVDQSSSDIQSNSFFGSDTEAKVSFWCVSASVGASVDKEKAQANSSFGENLVLQSLNTGGTMLVRGVKAMSDPIYNCTFDAFKYHYDPVVKATTTLEYVHAYKDFSENYGDSCVTKVHLIAGSALQITLKDGGSARSSNAKYGASASVSTPFGGVSDATKWGNGMKSKHAGGTLHCEEVHFPIGSKNKPPTYDLIHNEFVLRLDKAVDQLFTDGDKFMDNKKIPPQPEVTAPVIEKVDLDKKKAPEKQKLPDDETKESEEEVEDRKKKQIKIKKLKDNTTKKNGASNVVKEGRRARKKKKKYGLLSNNNTILTGVEDKSSLYGATPADYNGWNLGGFWVNAFETTKWTALFPELERTFPLDDSPIFIARVWLYLLTRIEFLAYLNIVVDVGDDIAPHWGEEKANLRNTKIDVQIFSELCGELKKKIKFALENQSVFSQVNYLDMIIDFDEKLRDTRYFSSMKVYDTFFDHYDVFHNNPLGFVEVSHKADGDVYTAVADSITTHPVGTNVLPTLLTDARRCYPVINVDGNAVMVAYQRESGKFVVVPSSQSQAWHNATWDEGDTVCIRHEQGLFLDAKKDSNNVYLHSATNENEDTRQWKFEKQGLGDTRRIEPIGGGYVGSDHPSPHPFVGYYDADNFAIKNIVTGKYLDGRNKNYAGKTGAGILLVTDRTPFWGSFPLLWNVSVTNMDVESGNGLVGLQSVGSDCYLNGRTSPYPGLNTDVNDAGLFTMVKLIDSVPGNFFQDFHKVSNDKLGLEAYISSDERTTFVGLNYEHLHLNKWKMAGVPFLSRLPFDEIVSPIHRDEA